MPNILAPFLGSLLVELPLLLTWLTGIVLALVFWKRNPKVSLLTLIAIIGLGLSLVVNVFLSMWLPASMESRHLSVAQLGMMFTVSGVITSLFSAVMWGLLLAAVFGWRQKAA